MADFTSGFSFAAMWRQACREHAHRDFLVYEDPDTGEVVTWTYSGLEAEVNRAANVLTDLGVEAGDRVGVRLGNSVEFVELLLALGLIGAVLVPLSATSTARECCEVLSRTEARLLVVEKPCCGREIACHCTGLTILPLREGPGSYDARKMAAPTSFAVPADVPGSALLEIMFTSGTTAEPKGTMLTHANFVFSGAYVGWELALQEGDRYLTSMAASHVNFQLSALAPVIATGSCLVMLRRYSARRFWGEVRRHRATVVQAMAMIVRTLLAQPPHEEDRLHHVREVHYFLSLSDQDKKEFENRYAVTLLNNYGSTETLVGVITDLPGLERRWPSIGRVGLGYEARVARDDGSQASPGETGELWIAGSPGTTLMAGYWRDPQATREAIPDGRWYRTGDFGYTDADGWFYFVDRRRDLIKRGGESISASEVENVLRSCPGVLEAAVLGVPDDIRDEAVCAYVVREAGSTVSAREIHRYAGLRLEYFKVPTTIIFAQSLPVGEYGKVIKDELSEVPVLGRHEFERRSHGNRHDNGGSDFWSVCQGVHVP